LISNDKYGRKRILLIGVPLYVLSSIFCVLSQDVFQLIAARIFQAIGGGAAMAVNLAIVKDVFPGTKRERTLAFGYLSVSISRPPSSSLLLEQQDEDTGSASSLIQASFVLSGSIGMLFISYDWSNRIMVLGIMNLVLSSGGLLLWIYAKGRCRIPKHFARQ